MIDPTREGENFWACAPEKIHNPYPDFAWFRENKPVYFHEGLGQWFVFRHADVTSLFSDPRLSANRLAGMRQATPQEAWPDLDRIAPYFDAWVLTVDGPRHQRLRRALHAGFDSAVIESLRGSIQTSADALLDKAEERLDVCEDYAFLLTAYVLADFLGVHPQDREFVVRWSMDFIDYFNVAPITVENTRKMAASGMELIAYTKKLLNERRAAPKNDFLGTLIKQEGAVGMADDEIVANAMLLLLAGHIAVRNFIGNTVWLLFQHPDQFQLLKEQPALLNQAVEESLRCETPVAAIPRVATEDFEYAGCTIRQGQIMQLLLTSANRDPAVYKDPGRFDITRQPGRVMSFGHGPHTCLGAMLAREETRIALETLYRRMPALAPDPAREITWYRNLGNRGPINLPVVF